MAPTPGAVINSRTRPSSRARERRRFSSFCHCSKSVLRAASNASATVDSVVWVATSSRIRPGKVSLCRRADLRPEATQHPAQAHLDIMVLGLQQLAGCQQRSDFLRWERFAVHRTEPAEPHQLGDATRILSIGLDRHCLECVPDVPGLEQLDGQSRMPAYSHCDSGPASSPIRVTANLSCGTIRSGSRARWPPSPRAR